MKGNNSGISMISLVITIIAVVILSAIVIRVGLSGIDLSNETRMSAERKEIESAIETRYADYSINPDLYPLIGKEVSVSDLSNISGINVENIEYIRILDKRDLQNLGIKNTTGASYIVDYMSSKVFGPND